MQIRKVNSRGVLFTFSNPEWDLNIYLITGKKYNYLIDTGLGSTCVDTVKNYLKNDTKETMVINTHYHWDHVWGNGSIKENILIAHRLCLEMLLTCWDKMLAKNNRFCLGEAQLKLPDLVFETDLYFPEDRIRLFHTPGHTADSISIFDEEDQVLILGDNVGDNMEEIIPALYCEKSVYINTMEKYLSLDFDTCITGHNTILGKDVIRQILSLL